MKIMTIHHSYILRREVVASSSSESDDENLESIAASRGYCDSRGRRARASYRNTSTRGRSARGRPGLQIIRNGSSQGPPTLTNEWIASEFSPKEFVRLEPAYLYVDTEDWSPAADIRRATKAR